MTDPMPYRWPLVNSGGSWSLPPISLPGFFSLQWDMPLENWLIAGHAFDSAGDEYSLSVYIGRVGPPPFPAPLQLAALGVGVGDASAGRYHMYTGGGLGVSDSDPRALLFVPPAGDYAFSATFADPPASFAYTSVLADGHPLGLAKATYALSFSVADQANEPMSLSVTLIDELGTRMEDTSGYNAPPDASQAGLPNYEVAQPRLRITGGKLIVGGKTVELVDGNLWNDRQAYTFDPLKPPDLSGPMYRGCWIPLVFDSGLSGVVSVGWPKAARKGTQWISGRDVGVPPESGHGNLFFPLGLDRYNGGAFLEAMGDDWDFDVNIFDPTDHGAHSPNWKSGSDIVYCTKFRIRFHRRLKKWGVPPEIFLVPLVESCEFRQGGAAPFFEGAARMYSDRACKKRIGYAWIEQMGYN